MIHTPVTPSVPLIKLIDVINVRDYTKLSFASPYLGTLFGRDVGGTSEEKRVINYQKSRWDVPIWSFCINRTIWDISSVRHDHRTEQRVGYSRWCPSVISDVKFDIYPSKT